MKGRTRAALAIAIATCVSPTGCARDGAAPTQVIVLVNAEAEVRRATAEVRLNVRNSDGDDALDELLRPSWPIKLALAPAGADASRTYVVTAEALDGDGALLARARLASGYVQGEKRFVVLLLEAACLGVACGRAGDTCHAGKCTLADVAADQFATVRSKAPDVGSLVKGSDADAGTAPPRGDGGSGQDGGSGAGSNSSDRDAGGSGSGSGSGGSGGSHARDGGAGSAAGNGGEGGGAGSSGQGGTGPADPCAVNHGGCDPLVACSADGERPRCGACPQGYEDRGGDGSACADLDACAGSPVCTAAFPCVDLPAPSLEYRCRGQYAEWKPSDSPASFTAVGDGTVSDARSGLLWQEHVDSGSHDWEQAKAYCDALDLAERMDWRLPARAELESLIDFTRFASSIDPALFPGTPDDWFWSSSPEVGTVGNAWAVVFDNGNSFYTEVTRPSRVRCVAGASGAVTSAGAGGAPPGRFAVRADGTVQDVRTTLTWQRVADAATLSQAQAGAHCASLALAGGGWRLPTISELLTIVDPTHTFPTIDPLAFPGTPTDVFWSSTPHATAPNEVWNVYFFYGNSSSSDPATPGRARCVR